MNNTGFSNGKPIAAFTIYKCLLHWKSFEAEKTSVFDRLIQMIGSAIEVTRLVSTVFIQIMLLTILFMIFCAEFQNQDNNDHLAYWLSNTSALLFLLQRSLKAAGAPRKPPPSTSLFGRMTMVFRIQCCCSLRVFFIFGYLIL